MLLISALCGVGMSDVTEEEVGQMLIFQKGDDDAGIITAGV